MFKAAHCFGIDFGPSITVIVGSSRRRGEGGITHRVIRTFVHPDYIWTREPFNLQNDVAVVRTLTRIRFGSLVQPIALGTVELLSGSQVILTGWGLTGEVRIVIKLSTFDYK